MPNSLAEVAWYSRSNAAPSPRAVADNNISRPRRSITGAIAASAMPRSSCSGRPLAILAPAGAAAARAQVRCRNIHPDALAAAVDGAMVNTLELRGAGRDGFAGRAERL